MASTAPKTGIKVVIVGAGFGGLAAAIECHRQAHDVEIYESFPELMVMGDSIMLGINDGHVYFRWGKFPGEVGGRMRAVSLDQRTSGFNIHKFDTGEMMFHQPNNDDEPSIFGHRGELHKIVFDYAKDEVGVPIHLGQNIQGYFEDEKQAGIVLSNGEKVYADVVIGADGVRSKARELVLGVEDKPKSSGYAVWRAWFPDDDMKKDPRTAHICECCSCFA